MNRHTVNPVFHLNNILPRKGRVVGHAKEKTHMLEFHRALPGLDHNKSSSGLGNGPI